MQASKGQGWTGGIVLGCAIVALAVSGCAGRGAPAGPGAAADPPRDTSAPSANADSSASDAPVPSSAAEVTLRSLLSLSPSGAATSPAAPSSSAPHSLPLPHTVAPDEYERQLYAFLDGRRYASWTHDKGVRDTGPLIDGAYYGTHNAVRVYYSPQAMDWLEGGRVGDPADGAMIIKEMFKPPAARYSGDSPALLQPNFNGWATMVRDRALAKDGWYWSYYAPGQAVDSDRYPFDYPNSGDGQYCARCHASAESAFTFATLRNIAGFPGDPVQFRVDNSWLATPVPVATPLASILAHEGLAFGPEVKALEAAKPVRGLNAEFARTFDAIPPLSVDQVSHLPPVTHDHVVAGPDGPGQFVTSDQCMGCHDGQGLPFGPNMYLPATEDRSEVNLSPYGEWSWSMMGLAGRDPIMYAQLESERKLQPSHAAELTNLCLSCHGVMGQRQAQIDHPGSLYPLDAVFATGPDDPLSRYGALSRDGISCTVCHQMVDDGKPIETGSTGRFTLSTPGEFEPGISNIYGPYDDPVTLPMSTTLGMKPVQSDYITSSRLCGSCHTINLPVYAADGRQVGTFYEQATYLEWQNSAYQDEFDPPGTSPQSCQDCHMPKRYPDSPEGQPLTFRIANIQDQTYPEVDNLAPVAEITVPLREDFARHTLVGLNQFALEMFKQFDVVLGVRKTDYMTGSAKGLPNAIAASNALATERTARVDVSDLRLADGRLRATVKVTNLAGHRLPSGVGFRRAFLEFRVLDAQNNVVWVSGATDSVGQIVGPDGQPLPTEYFEVDPGTGEQRYQPHHQTITRPDQVQIYEEIVQDPQGKITSSFLNLAHVVKDNRLLPLGWTPQGPPGFTLPETTAPEGSAAEDADFTDGSGSDTLVYDVPLPAGFQPGGRVLATLYYQATPPSYLRDRFTTVPEGPNTQRLHYLASHLSVEGTNIDDWKLRVAGDVERIGAGE